MQELMMRAQKGVPEATNGDYFLLIGRTGGHTRRLIVLLIRWVFGLRAADSVHLRPVPGPPQCQGDTRDAKGSATLSQEHA
jgi:hypothetical protein